MRIQKTEKEKKKYPLFGVKRCTPHHFLEFGAGGTKRRKKGNLLRPTHNKVRASPRKREKTDSCRSLWDENQHKQV